MEYKIIEVKDNSKKSEYTTIILLCHLEIVQYNGKMY